MLKFCQINSAKFTKPSFLSKYFPIKISLLEMKSFKIVLSFLSF